MTASPSDFTNALTLAGSQHAKQSEMIKTSALFTFPLVITETTTFIGISLNRDMVRLGKQKKSSIGFTFDYVAIVNAIQIVKEYEYQNAFAINVLQIIL